MKEDIFVEDTQDYKLEGKVLDSHGNIKIRISHKFGGRRSYNRIVPFLLKYLGLKKLIKKILNIYLKILKKKEQLKDFL